MATKRVSRKVFEQAARKATEKSFEKQREKNMDIKNELAFLRRAVRKLTLRMFRLEMGGKRG